MTGFIIGLGVGLSLGGLIPHDVVPLIGGFTTGFAVTCYIKMRRSSKEEGKRT